MAGAGHLALLPGPPACHTSQVLMWRRRQRLAGGAMWSIAVRGGASLPGRRVHPRLLGAGFSHGVLVWSIN